MKKTLLVFLFFSGCVYYNTFYNAQKYYDEKNYNKSIEKCKKILDKHRDSKYADDALFIMGKSYYYLKNFDEARVNLKKLIEDFPTSPFRDEGYLFLGKIALEKKDLDGAILFLDKASSSDDSEIKIETFKTKLGLYLIMDNPQKAIEEGEKIIDKYGGHSEEVYFIIGSANREIGNQEKALEMYKKALKESKEEPSGSLIYNLAEIYSEMDSLEKTLSVIEKGKQNDSLCLLKGKTLMKLKNLEEAEKSFRMVEQKKDSLGATAKYHLGEIKEYQGDTSAALGLYKEAVSKGDFGEITKKAQAKEKIFENLSLLNKLSQKIQNDKQEVDYDLTESYEKKDSSYLFFRIGEIYYWDLEEKLKGIEWYKKVYETFPASLYAPKAIFTLLNISITEDSTYSAEANNLFSMLTGKYPNTPYAKRARELYDHYVQDTTGTRE
jgi:tetratricopeptide (TPR) repeat protein